MECPESQNTTQRPLAAPATRGGDGDKSSNIVLVVVDEQAERPVQKLHHISGTVLAVGQERTYIIYQFTQAGITADQAFGTTNHVVTVWQQTSNISGRVWNHIKNVPDILSNGERGPL